MLRMFSNRRSVRRSVRRTGRNRGTMRQVRVRKGEMSTSPPEKLNKNLLPCHVRLLDGTDLYIQMPVSSTLHYPHLFRLCPSLSQYFSMSWYPEFCSICSMHKTIHVQHDLHGQLGTLWHDWNMSVVTFPMSCLVKTYQWNWKNHDTFSTKYLKINVLLRREPHWGTSCWLTFLLIWIFLRLTILVYNTLMRRVWPDGLIRTSPSKNKHVNKEV